MVPISSISHCAFIFINIGHAVTFLLNPLNTS